MSNILDKTFTVRQIWRWMRYAVYLTIPLYVGAVFLNAWDMKIRGVSLNNSSFKDSIPTQCSGYVEKSFGTPAGRTLIDEILLIERTRRYSLDQLISNSSPLIPCLGYAVLGGLHGGKDANFTDQYVDVDGTPIVTVRIEFHKKYVPETGDNK